MIERDDGPAEAPRALSRGDVFRTALLATGGALAGGLLAGGLPGVAAQKASKEQDAEILNFVLQLERLQAAFYTEALKRAKLTGELREFATVVGGHEREHLAFVQKALGSAAKPAPQFDFREATADADAFSRAARELEDLGVGAYNAGAPSLTPDSLRAAARIVSVEARHAAWIRDLAGNNPAPDASEPVTTAARVSAVLDRTGYIR